MPGTDGVGAPRLLLETDEQQETADLDGTVTPRAFEFGSRPVRTVMRDGELWFVAADVCAVLEHSNSRKAVGVLDENEIGVTIGYTLGGAQRMTIVNESGLYSLVFASRKPQAKAFRRWVTADVLPAIRRAGRYEASRPEDDSQARQQAQAAPLFEFNWESLPAEMVDFLVLPRLARVEVKAQELDLVKSLIRQGLDQASFTHPVSRRRVFTRPSLDAWWAARKMELAASTPSGP